MTKIIFRQLAYPEFGLLRLRLAMEKAKLLEVTVMNQLRQHPLLKDCCIIVAIQGRKIILSGEVNKFFKKGLISKIAIETTGINSVTDNLSVRLSNPKAIEDRVIANAVKEKCQINFGTSCKNILVTVSDGQVVLEGTVKWNYQKLLATECISFIDGIVSIENRLLANSIPEPEIRETDILAAIYQKESITSDIGINLNGRTVILNGAVNSASQKNLVEQIVRNISGVHKIENHLTIVKKH